MAYKRDCSHLNDIGIKYSKPDSSNSVSLQFLQTEKYHCLLDSTLVSEAFLELEYKLANYIELNVSFKEPVCYIYNPLQYAKEVHCNFVRKFCKSKKDVLLVGMNPGPWGMCQTGVPFGQVAYVRDWLKISGNIEKPINEHPSKTVQGFACMRNEVSGSRLWNLLKELSLDSPNNLFEHIFLHNYCPLAFLSKTGKNITPPEIKISERKLLEKVCDESLIEVVNLLNVKHLVCIGNYVTKKANKALQNSGVHVVTLMHPSPINPAANKGWTDIAKKQLNEAGILEYFGGCVK